MADVDVAVIGAGPVGLAAAVELRRHGASVALLDRAAAPAGESRAAMLHVRTLESFEAMGIADRFVRQSFPLDYVSLHAFGKRLGGLRLHGIDGAYPGPRTIGQDEVERLLAGRLAELGVTPERPVEVIDLAEDADGVALTCRDGTGGLSTRRARYGVACDGLDSPLRTLLGIPFAGDRHESFEVLQADATLRWSYPSGRGYTFVGKDRFLALFPFDGEGSYRVLSARLGPEAGDHAPPAVDELEAILRGVADPGAVLLDPRWLARWHSAAGLAGRFREGRVFLAGDAAHCHVPVGGQGLNIGIQDAFNLAWKLAAVVAGRAHPRLLDTYEPERRPIADEVIRHTDRGFHIMVQPGDLAGFALRLFGSSVVALESVQERLRRVLGEVAYGYPGSPLAQDLGGTIGPLAGERVVDGVTVRAADGRTLRFLEALNGTAWQLVAFAGVEGGAPHPALIEAARAASERFGGQLAVTLVMTGPSPGPDRLPVLWDRECLLHDRYGVRGPALYLIRPDWYVGFRAPAQRADAVMAYLESWLVPG